MKENAFTKWWSGFSEKHPGAAKWIREGGLFFLFSNLVTVWQYILIQFLPGAFSAYKDVEWMWPGIRMNLFGATFTFNVLGYSVADGGLAAVGVNYTNLGSQTADMVLKIVTGTPVSQVPVEVLRDNNLVINGDTARAIGVDISQYGPNDATFVSSVA